MNHNPVDLQAQETARRTREERALLAVKQEADDVKWLMSSKRGRRIIWRHLDRAGVFRSSFNTNAMQMAFTEGVRNEGLRLLGLVHTAADELYPIMVKENASE